MIVTTRNFRANQGKYIRAAHNGEEVILTSKNGDVKLTPVDEDAELKRYVNSYNFLAAAEKAENEYKEGKTVSLKSHKDIDDYFNSL